MKTFIILGLALAAMGSSAQAQICGSAPRVTYGSYPVHAAPAPVVAAPVAPAAVYAPTVVYQPSVVYSVGHGGYASRPYSYRTPVHFYLGYGHPGSGFYGGGFTRAGHYGGGHYGWGH